MVRLTKFGKTVVCIMLLATLTGARSAPAEVEQIPAAMYKVDYVPHQVLSGETISEIAERYRKQWQTYAPASVVESAITEHNARRLYNGYLLRAGDVIEIPIWKNKKE